MILNTIPTVLFETSGTTGSPVHWWRSEKQMHLECSIMIQQIGDADAVISFASPSHIFGDIFGKRIPDILGIQCTAVTDILAPISFPNVSRIFIICVPSTWKILERQHKFLLPYQEITFIHSAGALPKTSMRVLEALGNRSSIFEILGSTECGGIATRRKTSLESGQWAVLSDVNLIGPSSGTGLLEITSPRLASRSKTIPTEKCRTDDIVRRTGPASFEYLGRRDRIIKFDGRRFDLDEIDRQIEASVSKHVASVLVEDELRGSSFDVYVEDGDPLDEAIIRKVSPLQPQEIHLHGKLPRTTSGKIDFQHLISQSTQGLSFTQ
ncbi:MAG: hypothetical protein COB78_07100 [Hyphomicrobiales bacterium]|nr:MAG: hypothetical protein COB78_07100 [Hyphomicrobiales bacterium]